MSAADVRDVLELPGPGEKTDGVRRPPAKKQKTVEKRPDGITRELYALLGEHPPPVSLTLKSHFKERPRWLEKAKPWEQRAFQNPARTDGLVLRHWVAKKSPNTLAAASTDACAEGGGSEGGDAMQLDTEHPQTSIDTDYHFSRFNIKPKVLQYTDTEYLAVGGAGGENSWTREETDYLWQLCSEYDLRFNIISDRYDYYYSTSGTPGLPRSLEDIKYRYYSLVRALLAHRTPVHLMTPEETNYYQLLLFDRDREVARKTMVETLFNRTPEEVKEEEYLLAEMKRILATQEKLLEERQDLFNRLDAPASTGSIAAYTSSAGLGNLTALMHQGDKSKKRKSIVTGATGPPNIDTAAAIAGISRAGEQTPTTAGVSTPTMMKPGETPREMKKALSTRDSTAANTPTTATVPAARLLSPATASHYGVTYPSEKLASGVYLRSSKIAPIKGGSAQKVQAALGELGVPPKLTMATEKTCKKMEGLNQVVSQLLDARRLLEKLEGELRVEKARLENLAG